MRDEAPNVGSSVKHEGKGADAPVSLRLLITGATGYLGRELVRQCLIAGHHLTLIVRDAAACPIEWEIDQRIEIIEGDLVELKAVPQSDVVLHLAASLAGDAATQQRDTVEASRSLLIAALRTETPPGFVLASSMAVYGAMGLRPGDVVDETTPLEDAAHLRDTYCRAKLGQELLFSTAASDAGLPLQVLRIGAIWGPGRLWNAHLGIGLGPALLRLEAAGDLPLAHLRHAAQALRLAAEAAGRGESAVVNVVDSNLPSRAQYLAAHRKTGWPRLTLPLPWRWLEIVARLTGSRLRPGLLKTPTLRYRMLPLRYDNATLRRMGWQPEAGFDALMEEALQATPPQEAPRG